MKTNPGTVTMVAIVSVLASLSLLGCGNGQGRHDVADSNPAQTTPDRSFTATAQAADASSEPARTPGLTPESVPADSLPPDVSASVADSVVTPGATAEVTARASADAADVFLWDGIGRKQSFSYDSTAGIWRARYRVPLGAGAGRLGLSVTARNRLDLRSRVWVFVRVDRSATGAQPKQPETRTAPESGR